METISTAKAFGGTQGVYSHQSKSCKCDMTFAVYMPPQASNGPVPLLWYLSGLTCSHANVMDKGDYRQHAAKHGVAIICPDTSPRGEDVPDDKDNWQFGSGAGFYLNATQQPMGKKLPDVFLHHRGFAGTGGKRVFGGYGPTGNFRPLHGRPWGADVGFEKSGHFQKLFRICSYRSTQHC